MKLFLFSIAVLSLTTAGTCQEPPWVAPNPELQLYDSQVVMNPEGKKELGLTRWQRTRFDNIIESLSSRRIVNLNTAEGRAAQSAYMDNFRTGIYERTKAMLTPAQLARWKEVSLQLRGPSILTQSFMRTEFGITHEQASAIQELSQKQFAEIQAAVPMQVVTLAGGAEPAAANLYRERQRKVKAVARSSAEKMFAVLTPAQLKKWSGLVGRPYSYGEGEPPPPGTVLK